MIVKFVVFLQKKEMYLTKHIADNHKKKALKCDICKER